MPELNIEGYQFAGWCILYIVGPLLLILILLRVAIEEFGSKPPK